MRYEVKQEAESRAALFRELQPGEERYYTDEPQRLHLKEGRLWLHIKSGTIKEIQKEKQRLERWKKLHMGGGRA